MKPINPYKYILFTFFLITIPFTYHYLVPKYYFIERGENKKPYRCNVFTGQVDTTDYSVWH